MSQNIDQLINQLATAKHAEAEAKITRIQAEEAILAAVELPEKGSKTFAAPGLKLTVQTGLNYKADITAVERIDSDFVKTKKELDERAYEDTRVNNPELFAKLSQHVVVTPKKPTLTLKLG